MEFVEICPKTLEEVIFASARMGCGTDSFGNKQYMCLPNVEKTSLVEFCYNGLMGIHDKVMYCREPCCKITYSTSYMGVCLEVNSTDRTLSQKSCTDFRSGCPEIPFWNYQFYKYPACQDINVERHCYTAQPSCKPAITVSDESDVTKNTLIAVAITSFIVTVIVVAFVLIKKFRNKGNKEAKTLPSIEKTENEEREANAQPSINVTEYEEREPMLVVSDDKTRPEEYQSDKEIKESNTNPVWTKSSTNRLNVQLQKEGIIRKRSPTRTPFSGPD